MQEDEAMTAQPKASIDYAGAYRELRDRVTELVRANDDSRLDVIAPATPAWRVRDVVAHLAGVCDDVTHGNMDGVASDEWTGA
jgi:Mycothiol maleylpyruvate isomerase N-terminal domain